MPVDVEDTATDSNGFNRHARTVTLMTLLSRATGLVRDGVLSRLFGAGTLMSAFFFAFMIPNLFRRLFGEGALAAAFLPTYATLHRDRPDVARAFAAVTVALLAVFLGVITFIAELALGIGVWLLDRDTLALELMMIMLPYMPLVCLVAVLGAMLQVRGRFGPTAAAPIVLNLMIVLTAICCAVLLKPDGIEDGEQSARMHVMLIAMSVILAGMIQLAWSLAAVGERGWLRARSTEVREHVRTMIRMAGPMILSLGVLQLNTFFDGVIASYPVTFATDAFFGFKVPMDDQSMAVISFAQRLYQFPLGVFGIAVATAIFPALARLASDEQAFRNTLQRGIRLVVFIGLPASAGLILVRSSLTSVIFAGGEFTAEDTERVARVLLGYAPAIWAYSLTHVLTRAFYARGDSKRPVGVAVWMVGLNIVLNLTLINFLGEAGLAWSTSICATLQALLLMHIFQRHHIRSIVDREVVKSVVWSMILTTLMTGAVVGATLALGALSEADWTSAILLLIVQATSGMLAYAAAAYFTRPAELRWALGSEQD